MKPSARSGESEDERVQMTRSVERRGERRFRSWSRERHRARKVHDVTEGRSRGLSKQTILRFRRCSGWDPFRPNAAVKLLLHHLTMNAIRQVQQLNKRELENAM
jgi:hypothetical protein